MIGFGGEENLGVLAGNIGFKFFQKIKKKEFTCDVSIINMSIVYETSHDPPLIM